MNEALPPLEVLDADGALRDAVDDVETTTRSGFMRKALGGAGLVVGGSLAFGEFGAFAASRKTDVKILQLALVLERLGADFYEEALHRVPGLSGETLEFTHTLLGHERAHVKAVEALIRQQGGRPNKSPRFDFGSTTHSRLRFRSTSSKIEELCVEALNGTGPLVTKTVLAHAGELVSVEARHVSWINQIMGADPVPRPFDLAVSSPSQARSRALATGFIKSTLPS